MSQYRMQQQLEGLEKTIITEYGNTAGIVVLKNGRTVYENYFNGCGSGSHVHVCSVTKSIISLLIGTAIDNGFIESVDQKVLEFFPTYKVEDGGDSIRDITIEELLTMTAPYKIEEELYMEYFTSSDYVRFSLDSLGGQEKAGKFKYAALIGPDILSGILVRATGRSVADFGAEYLFSPLGIAAPDKVIFQSEEEQMAFNTATDRNVWAADPNGVNTAGWGLAMTAGDMAKIGQMCLDGGRWNGRQILSEKWISESMKEHSRWEEMGLSYGYLWWIDKDGFAAMGDGGNVIYVNTRKRLVVSITALPMPDAADRIDFIKGYIEPVFGV